MQTEEWISEAARQIPVAGKSDVLVVGGGPAGIGAALAAARTGARVSIVEHYGFLGGMWTAGLLNPILDHKEKGGIVAELIQRLDDAGMIVLDDRYNFDTEYLKYMLDKMMTEAGVEIRLHRLSAGAVVEGNQVKGIITESKSGREALLADVVIDCTGDGDVAAQAGVPFTLGDENGEMQAMTLFFMLANVNYYQQSHGTDIYDMLTKAANDNGLDYTCPYKTPSFFDQPERDRAIVQIAHVFGFDGTNADDLTRAEIDCRQQIQETIKLMQLVPQLKGVNLVTSGPHIGVRETRHIAGRYMLVEDDLLQGRTFDDGICWARFVIDIHGKPKAGTIAIQGGRVKPYQIPYRSLIAKNREGLLMAGRCISGTSRAHASFRVTGDCVAMGQAAGSAAALAVRQGIQPSQLDHQVLVNQLKTDNVAL